MCSSFSLFTAAEPHLPGFYPAYKEVTEVLYLHGVKGDSSNNQLY